MQNLMRNPAKAFVAHNLSHHVVMQLCIKKGCIKEVLRLEATAGMNVPFLAIKFVTLCSHAVVHQEVLQLKATAGMEHIHAKLGSVWQHMPDGITMSCTLHAWLSQVSCCAFSRRHHQHKMNTERVTCSLVTV